MLIQGKCHCGNIAFILAWTPEPKEIPARSCSCSFCSKHGAVWTSCRQGTLDITVVDPSRMSRYQFGTRTAQFLTCMHCGVVPVCTSQIEGKLYAVVNVNTFESFDRACLSHGQVDFDGEATDARLERRQRYWIENVRYVEGAIA